jgi:PAS domain S-box-containing protein
MGTRSIYPDEEEYNRVGIEMYEETERRGLCVREVREKRRDGAVIHVNLSMSPLESHDVSRGVCITSMDITEQKGAENALFESEEKYRLLVENAGDAICVAQDGRLKFANRRAEELLGYSGEEISALPFINFIHPDDRTMVMDYHLKRIRGEPAPEVYAFRVMDKDGNTRWAEIQVVLISWEGRPATLNLITDITERKRVEHMQRESEERLRGITNNLPGLVFQFAAKDTGEWLVTYHSERVQEIFGLANEEMTDLFEAFLRYTHKDDLENLVASIRKAAETCSPWNHECRIITPQGRLLWMHGMSTPTRHEDRVVFNGIMLDITERKLAEEALRKSEERYRTILDSTEGAYFELDLMGNFTFFNEAAMTMSGYSREELQGMNYRQYAPPDTEQRMFETFHQVYVTGMPQQLVGYQVIHKNGSLRDNELSVWPMKDASGNTVGFHALVRDVTSRKSAEKALRENEERYRAIFENTGNASILIAKDTTILLANSNFAKLTGYSKEEMDGKMSWTTFVEAADLERMKQYHERRRVDSSLAPQSYEFRLKASSGELRDMFLTIVMIPGTMESVASCMDITDRRRAEEELKEREAKYRFLTEKMNDVVWTMGLDLRTTYVSPSITRVLGFTPEERMAQDPRDQLTPDSFSEALRILSYELERDSQPGVDPERTIIFEGEYCHKDGSRVWLENNITGIRNEQGNIVGLHGLSRDVTERKKTARALKESEEKYRTILESMEEAYLEVDLAGAFTFFNDSFLRIIGYSREEISGMNYKDISRPETVAGLYRLFNEIYRTGNKRTLINHEIIRKDGSPGIVEMSISLMRGAGGEPVGFGGVGRDVTARILAERALKESERKYRLLAENLRDVIWVLDADLKYIYVSPSVMRLRGYTPEEAMAQTMKEVLAPSPTRGQSNSLPRENSLRTAARNTEWNGHITSISR